MKFKHLFIVVFTALILSRCVEVDDRPIISIDDRINVSLEMRAFTGGETLDHEFRIDTLTDAVPLRAVEIVRKGYAGEDGTAALAYLLRPPLRSSSIGTLRCELVGEPESGFDFPGRPEEGGEIVLYFPTRDVTDPNCMSVTPSVLANLFTVGAELEVGETTGEFYFTFSLPDPDRGVRFFTAEAGDLLITEVDPDTGPALGEDGVYFSFVIDNGIAKELEDPAETEFNIETFEGRLFVPFL